MSETIDIWRLLGGLGIFLFGIFLMEQSIRDLAGNTFKRLIRSYTGTRFSAILSGTVSTAILQSSSAVTLMVLAFTGAGLMSITNAIGVIIGSNIGTTFTAWIVAIFGFEMSIESFALPIIGIGGLGLVFVPSTSRYRDLARLLIGFGLLFHGLDYMKTGVEEFTRTVNLGILEGFGLWLFVLAGTLLTALIQSSSATIAIVLAGIHSGAIGIEAGAALVIGANIGTTITVMLGAVGGIPIKKRVAASHLVFNLGTGAVAYLLLPLLIWLVEAVLGWDGNAVLGIVLFHTLFNLMGVVLFMPFIGYLTGWLGRLYPEPEQIFTHYIQNTSPEVAEAALEAFRREVLHQYVESRNYLVRLFRLDIPLRPPELQDPLLQHSIPGSREEVYLRLQELHGEIFKYYSLIDNRQLDERESKELELYLRSSRSFMNAVLNLQEVHGELEDYELADGVFLNSQPARFRERLKELLAGLDPLLAEGRDAGRAGGADSPGYPSEGDREEAISPGDRIEARLDNIFERVEQHDLACINGSSKAIKSRELDEMEATSLLMSNRLFTQSCRMVVLSLRNLLPGTVFPPV